MITKQPFYMSEKKRNYTDGYNRNSPLRSNQTAFCVICFSPSCGGDDWTRFGTGGDTEKSRRRLFRFIDGVLVILSACSRGEAAPSEFMRGEPVPFFSAPNELIKYVQSLLPLRRCSSSVVGWSAILLNLLASSVSRRATMLLGGGRSLSSIAHAQAQLAAVFRRPSESLGVDDPRA